MLLASTLLRAHIMLFLVLRPASWRGTGHPQGLAPFQLWSKSWYTHAAYFGDPHLGFAPSCFLIKLRVEFDVSVPAASSDRWGYIYFSGFDFGEWHITMCSFCPFMPGRLSPMETERDVLYFPVQRDAFWLQGWFVLFNLLPSEGRLMTSFFKTKIRIFSINIHDVLLQNTEMKDHCFNFKA